MNTTENTKDTENTQISKEIANFCINTLHHILYCIDNNTNKCGSFTFDKSTGLCDNLNLHLFKHKKDFINFKPVFIELNLNGTFPVEMQYAKSYTEAQYDYNSSWDLYDKNTTQGQLRIELIHKLIHYFLQFNTSEE